jgi:hypothetical protein
MSSDRPTARVEGDLKRSIATAENWRDEAVRAKRVRGLRRAWRRRRLAKVASFRGEEI